MTASEWMSHLGDWFVPVPETGCWIWMRGLHDAGYGSHGRHTYAHRTSYRLLRGPIAKGLTVDHLCRVRCCVNPDHMEIVARGENVLRGVGTSATNARKTHCIHGHELSGNNLIIEPRNNRQRPMRRCRTCRNEGQNRRKRERIHRSKEE